MSRRVIQLPDPKASSFVFPVTAEARLRTLQFTFTTDAVVGSRRITLGVQDKTGVIKLRTLSANLIAANEVVAVSWAEGLPAIGAAGAPYIVNIPMPAFMELDIGDVVFFAELFGISAGDRLSSIVAVVDLL